MSSVGEGEQAQSIGEVNLMRLAGNCKLTGKAGGLGPSVHFKKQDLFSLSLPGWLHIPLRAAPTVLFIFHF